MGLEVGRPSSHNPCTPLPLGARTGEDARGAPPRGCIFGVTWLGDHFVGDTPTRHTEVTSRKQTEATITATKRLRGYKPAKADPEKKKKSLRKSTFFYSTEFCITGAVFFFFSYLYICIESAFV